MTDRMRPERLFAAWLELEAPPRAPEGLRDEILTATAGIRPRPAWLARLKGNHMDVIVGGRTRRQPLLIPVLIVLGLLLALGVGAALVGSRPPVSELVPAPATITMPGQVSQIAAADGAIWASTSGGRSTSGAPLPSVIHRVDPSTHEVRAVVGDLPLGHLGLTALNGFIWASHDEGDQALQWDASTGQQVAAYELGDQPLEPLAAYGSVWFPNYRSGTVTRIDATSGTRTKITMLGWPGGPRSIAAGGGRIWAIDVSADYLLAIDPATNEVTPAGKVLGFEMCGVGYAAGLVWAFRCDKGSAEVFDPATGTAVGVLESELKLGPVFEHEGAAWVVAVDEDLAPPRLLRIDTQEGFRVAAEFDPGLEATWSAIGPDAIWFAHESEIVRLPLASLPAD